MNVKWKKRLKLGGHSILGAVILAGAASLTMVLALEPGSLVYRAAEAVLLGQTLMVVGAANMYVMVKTPFRDVISSCADALEDAEVKWREGKLTPIGAQFARAAATEAAARVLGILLFAGLGLSAVTF